MSTDQIQFDRIPTTASSVVTDFPAVSCGLFDYPADLLLRGTIVNRTYGTHKKLYI